MFEYRFDENGVFIDKQEAYRDPLESKAKDEDVYILSANCTFKVPMAAKEGFVQVWNGSSWLLVEDHRGTRYWMPEDKFGASPKVCTTVGPLPKGALLRAPAQTAQEKLVASEASVRAKRDSLLSESDYYLQSDYPATEEGLKAVKSYRTDLRNVPQQAGFPYDVVWPETPDVLK